MTTPQNTLIIMSDEHSPRFMGCYGHPLVQTPHLDRLAASGVRFTNAYCNSPICVPSRASFATGQYVHKIRHWDSAQPYDGRIRGWAHDLREQGHTVTSIGKLHYRSAEDDNGFTESRKPLYVLNGVGWADALQRENPPPYTTGNEYAEQVGAGWSSYTRYDRRITDDTCRWLEQTAATPQDQPWALFCSLVSPHYPLVAPQEYLDLYPLDDIPLPFSYRKEQRPDHPGITGITSWLNYDDYFQNETHIRRARQAYFALCTFLDAQVGRLLTKLEETGQLSNTRIIYTSDHGDCLGNHGIWAKSVMYEDSAGIPFIMSGPDIPANKVIDTPISLVDCAPTIAESVGGALTSNRADLAGDSLFQIIQTQPKDRVVFCEHHDGGSRTGSFMIRVGRWKYIYHAGHTSQLFDLEADPDELIDLGENPAYADAQAICHAQLTRIVDPEKANAQAFGDQADKLAFWGGLDAIRNWQVFNCTPAPE